MRAVTRSTVGTARALLALGVVLAPALVRADAPFGQYESFLSTDDTVTDAKTRLVWDRLDIARGVLLKDIHCRPGSAHVATVKELATLLDNQPSRAYNAAGALVDLHIDPNAFPATPPERFWTASATPGGGVFVVDFGTGQIDVVAPADLASTRANVRCVKQGPP